MRHGSDSNGGGDPPWSPACIFYPAVGASVFDSAGVLGDDASSGGKAGLWVFVDLFALSTVVNLVSPSKVERIWAPVALVLTACFAILAIRS